MAYVPVPMIVPKSKKGANTFALVLLWIMLPVMLIGCIALATTSGTATVTDFTTVDAMQADEVYYIQSLSVLGSYGEVETTYTDNSKAVTERCYFVSFTDQNGQVCYASLGVTAGSSIYEQCENYDKSLLTATQQVEPLYLPGCYSVKTIESQMDQMEIEYNSAYRQITLALGGSGIDTRYHLTYEGATRDEYLDRFNSDNTIGLSLCAVFSVLLAVALFFTLRQRKKIKAQEQAAKEAMWQFEQNFAAQPNAPAYPDQPTQPVAPQAPVVPACPVCRNSAGNLQENGRWRCALCGTTFNDPAAQNFT